MDTDHYEVLGLASGEEGAKLTEHEISKAYKKKALILHPDKNPDDPNAHLNFQKLKSSYEILKDVKARKLFDDLLRVKRVRSAQRDSKRQKMVSDLEARERAAFASHPVEEEETIAMKFKEEVERIRAMLANKELVKPTMAAHYPSFRQSACLNNLVGTAYKSYEDSILEKLKKVAAARNQN